MRKKLDYNYDHFREAAMSLAEKAGFYEATDDITRTYEFESFGSVLENFSWMEMTGELQEFVSNNWELKKELK